jgi:hypothetical protein
MFQALSGSQFFVPPAQPPAAELTLPTDSAARQREIVRFLQQATFGARPDADGVAPWDPDSIEAVAALGYAGWIDAQLALDRGPDPETVVTQTLPPRTIYVAPTASLRTLRTNGNATGYNGSGPLASHVANHYRKFPKSSVGTVGAPLEDSAEIWRAWWKFSCTAPDQLRHRVAFALSQMFVVSEEGELDEQARGLTHYHDLLYWHGLGNFRTLLQKVTLNPSMGRYLDMLNSKKPNPATDRFRMRTSAGKSFSCSRWACVGCIPMARSCSTPLGSRSIPMTNRRLSVSRMCSPAGYSHRTDRTMCCR